MTVNLIGYIANYNIVLNKTVDYYLIFYQFKYIINVVNNLV